MPHHHDHSHRPPLGARPRPALADVAATLALTVSGPVLLWSSALIVATPAAGPAQAITHAVGLAAGALGTLLLLWWCIGAAGIALMALGGRTGRPGVARAGSRLAPAAMRRVAAGLLGLQLLGAPAAWADAGPAPGPAPSAAVTAAAGHAAPSVDASWLRPPRSAAVPDAAWTPHSPTPAPPGAGAPARPTTERATVTVREGDCLWDIAAAELGPDATLREIDLRWRDWHRANRGVIGDDPHLIFPGTVLVTPVFSPHAPASERVGP